jgi:hypothetical protein
MARPSVRGFLVTALGESRYEVHSLFLPEREPQEAVKTMRASWDGDGLRWN